MALALLLAACAQQGGAGREDAVMTLNRLPARIGALSSTGPATMMSGPNESGMAGRRYALTGGTGALTLSNWPGKDAVSDGPDAPAMRAMLEQVTRGFMAQPVPQGFGPWRREEDRVVRAEGGPPMRCTVLRRPRAETAQLRYTCMTMLAGRLLSAVATFGHDAMSANAAQQLAAGFAGSTVRILATGEGMVEPVPMAARTPKAPVPPALAEDDAMPDNL